ncbi:MAG: threonylcarbamoyl-AMP synthase [Prevotellaceae bacterium]|jgi:L-threonylcarbamoyladenylate synthase|nr:threonylcarbamoyl-AMP synthase [Prevotellaceae bacterium]
MKEDLKKAVEVLRNGGVILYPTDTVWGLGCDATNAGAVKRIYGIKRRADSKSMLVLTDSIAKVQAYTEDAPDVVFDLLEVADTPLTIIYPKARNLAENLVAEDGSIGIRITNETFSKTLCEMFRKPVVSTSANISGESAPRCFAEISDEIRQAVDYVVKFRQDDRTKSRPSSIIQIGKGGQVKIIRK